MYRIRIKIMSSLPRPPSEIVLRADALLVTHPTVSETLKEKGQRRVLRHTPPMKVWPASQWSVYSNTMLTLLVYFHRQRLSLLQLNNSNCLQTWSSLRTMIWLTTILMALPKLASRYSWVTWPQTHTSCLLTC